MILCIIARVHNGLLVLIVTANIFVAVCTYVIWVPSPPKNMACKLCNNMYCIHYGVNKNVCGLL